ncbi:MAG: hypothetical protein AMS14_07100, partial [Planctomycetes bacterium DG_20]
PGGRPSPGGLPAHGGRPAFAVPAANRTQARNTPTITRIDARRMAISLSEAAERACTGLGRARRFLSRRQPPQAHFTHHKFKPDARPAGLPKIRP